MRKNGFYSCSIVVVIVVDCFVIVVVIVVIVIVINCCINADSAKKIHNKTRGDFVLMASIASSCFVSSGE